MSKLTKKNLVQFIDHTLLRANAQEKDIAKLCQEALDFKVYSVCVNPRWVSFCKRLLNASAVKTITVVGFPLGADGGVSKSHTSAWAIDQGAEEIDMVMDIGAALDGDWNSLHRDIETVKRSCDKIPLKVILEISYLNNEQIKKSSEIAKEAGADFVKTSTGFSDSGATLEAVQIMRQCVGANLGVKASGGIRSFEQFENYILAGATRIGTSSTEKIVSQAP